MGTMVNGGTEERIGTVNGARMGRGALVFLVLSVPVIVLLMAAAVRFRERRPYRDVVARISEVGRTEQGFVRLQDAMRRLGVDRARAVFSERCRGYRVFAFDGEGRFCQVLRDHNYYRDKRMDSRYTSDALALTWFRSPSDSRSHVTQIWSAPRAF